MRPAYFLTITTESDTERAELSDMREKLPQLSRLIPSACINWEE